MKNILYIFLLLLFASQALAQKNTVKGMFPASYHVVGVSDERMKKYQADTAVYNKVYDVYKESGDEDFLLEIFTQEEVEIFQYYMSNEEELQSPLSTDPWGCSWYCGGGPDSVYASSFLPAYKDILYEPWQTHDFDLATAWVPSGNPIGQSLTFRFRQGSPPVTTFIIYNGYQKSEKTFRDNARVKAFKMYVNENLFAVLNLKDGLISQSFEFDRLQGLDSDLYIRLEIVDVYPGEKYKDVAVSEINFDGTGVHCFVAGTLISLPGDETMPVEKIKKGDKVLSFNKIANRTEEAVVLGAESGKHHNLYEYSFAKGKVTATDDHPFLLTEGKFAAWHPSRQYEIETARLEIGDKVMYIAPDGSIQEMELLEVKKLESCETTYTITELSKNKVFFANKIAVGIEKVKR